MRDKIKKFLKSRPKLKGVLHFMAINRVKVRPRLWLRLLRPLYIKRGWGSKIYSSARLDVTPFNKFSIGSKSVIESNCVINNSVGDVTIGSGSTLGVGSTIIGPVAIGSNVIIAQNVVISGMDHCYSDIETPIKEQGVVTEPITIANNVWIGANSVITKGATIGEHVVVAAGSVVRGDTPSFSVVAGSPATVVKRYYAETKEWKRV